MNDKRIKDIYCPNCGAPAVFDIVRQEYHCNNCGSALAVDDAIRQKQGYRSLCQARLKNELRQYRLFQSICGGCGAQVVFEEKEALASCPYCGRAMVRSDYLTEQEFPESVIPFVITGKEAAAALESWCRKNRSKKEAKLLSKLTDRLNGCYLPYELIQGPVHMKASRMDGFRSYQCEGDVIAEFVNRSSHLDNLLLDGMEPFDVERMTEFEFGYIADHHVRINDLNEGELIKRIERETGRSYKPFISKVLETDAAEIDSDVSSLIRLPVLLPVYYICEGDLMAAVNGQTGKVSVRSLKDSHYYFLPWWLNAILSTAAVTGILLLVFRLFGMDFNMSLMLCGILALFFIIVFLCMFSDEVHNRFAVVSGKKIFTSGETVFTRKFGELVPSETILKRKIREPVFFETLDGVRQPVVLKFVTPMRIFRLIVSSVVVLFLPVIVALFLNGFDFGRLDLAGSSVWFCIVVPLYPVVLLKYGIVELHDNPWIYKISENGKLKRWKKKADPDDVKEIAKMVLKALFIPPVSLGVWFGIFSFITMCWLTAFGMS